MTQVICSGAKNCPTLDCPHRVPHVPHKKGCKCGYCGTFQCDLSGYCTDIDEMVQCVETGEAE